VTLTFYNRFQAFSRRERHSGLFAACVRTDGVDWAETVFTRATRSIARYLLRQRGWLGGCLLHAGIVSKRLSLSLNLVDHLVAPSFWFPLTPAPIPVRG